MLNDICSISGEITCELSSKIEDNLKDIAVITSCNLTYKTIEKTSKHKTLEFEYEGNDKGIQKVKKHMEIWKLKSLEESLNLIFKKYKVRVINKQMCKGQFNISVNVNKFSRFINLAKTVVEELDITARMSEKNKGFLQGKDVTVESFGNKKELKAFKRLMESFMTQEEKHLNKQIKL
jgi:hypothetical protein